MRREIFYLTGNNNQPHPKRKSKKPPIKVTTRLIGRKVEKGSNFDALSFLFLSIFTTLVLLFTNAFTGFEKWANYKKRYDEEGLYTQAELDRFSKMEYCYKQSYQNVFCGAILSKQIDVMDNIKAVVKDGFLYIYTDNKVYGSEIMNDFYVGSSFYVKNLDYDLFLIYLNNV